METVNRTLFPLFLLAVIIGVPWVIYSKLDNAGYIPHHAAVTLHFNGNWLIGEDRQCNAAATNLEISDVFCNSAELLSSELESHHVNIKFWGEISSASRNFPTDWQWRCVRSSDGEFTCYAIN
jgi:hypothetical protein